MARKTRVGETRNLLTCVSEENINNIWFLHCTCECGQCKTIKVGDFGKTQSCGCLLLLAIGSSKHRLSKTTWSSMRKRCNFDWHHAYKNYGGRGIKVKERWNNLEFGFENFLEDMGYRPSNEMSLDRIDVNDDYYKENCRWADRKTQSNNRRTNIVLELDGETKTLSEWCEVFGKSIQMISHRVYKLGMSYEQALKTPKLKNRGKNKPKGQAL